MLYALRSGDPSGSTKVRIVEGPSGLDLDALWAEFNGPVDEFLGDEPDVTERSRFTAWHENRLAYLRDVYRGLTGRDVAAVPFLLTSVFAAWLCRHHGCFRPALTPFRSEL